MPQLNLDALHAYVNAADITPEVQSIARTMGPEVTMEVFVPISRPGQPFELF